MTVINAKEISSPCDQGFAQYNHQGIVAIMISVATVNIAFGMLASLIPLYAKLNGTNYFLIGVISAMTAVGALVIILTRSIIIRHLGLFRTIFLCITLAAGSVFLFPFSSDYVWLLLRFIQGMGFGLLFLTCDTWIQRLVTPETRGRVIAAYVTVQGICLGFGILLISIFEIVSIYPFITAACLFLVAIIPLVFIRNYLPAIETGSINDSFRRMLCDPQLCLSAFLFFALQASSISLLPLFGLHRGYTPEVSISLVTTLIVGSLLIQLPIGWFGDKIEQYTLLLLCMVGTVTGLMLLIILPNESNWVWSIIFLLGCFGGGIITVVMIIVGKRFTIELISINTSLNLINNMTYITVPTLVGLIMHVWNPGGLPVFLFLLTLAVLMALIFSGPSFSKASEIRNLNE